MSTTELVVINHQSGASAREVQAFVSALDEQLNGDLAPTWGRYVVPWVATSDKNLSPKAWRLHLWANPRDAKDAGALGHHETFGPDYVPVGHVFVQAVLREHEPWTTVASHEALEMVGNENVNLDVTRVRPDGGVELWPRELCDAVQGLSYVRKGVAVSNFLLPEYFIEGANGPYDKMGRLSKPFQIHPSGYSAFREIKGGRLTDREVYGAVCAEWRKRLNELSRRATRAKLNAACTAMCDVI